MTAANRHRKAGKTKAKPRSPRWRAPAGGEGGGLPGLPPASLDSTVPNAQSPTYPGPTVQIILQNTLGRLMSAVDFDKRTIVADNDYCVVSPGFILNSILTDPVLSSPQTYQADIFDCDDYVQFLKTKMSLYATVQKLPAPLAVGYVFTTLHAFSFCIGVGAEVFLINTQSTNHAVIKDPALYATFLSLSGGNNITCIYI